MSALVHLPPSGQWTKPIEYDLHQLASFVSMLVLKATSASTMKDHEPRGFWTQILWRCLGSNQFLGLRGERAPGALFKEHQRPV